MPRSLVGQVVNALSNLRYNYLFLPGLIAIALGALGAALARIDRLGGPEGILAIFPAGAPAAQTMLSTIAAAIATIAGVAFSITIVSLQLVSQQFTPRALRGFLGDRLNQTVAGVFIGVFLYCLTVLRTIQVGENAFLPELTVAVGIALAFVALGLLLVFVHHMGHSIQVSNIARRIADETLDGLKQPYPTTYGEPVDGADPADVVEAWEREDEPTLVFPSSPGFVQSVDDIPATISGDGFRAELLVVPGDFVTERHPIARVWPRGDAEACATAFRRAVAIGAERDKEQDIGFGIRQLADIAVKALSPSVNDPTTATTCVGYLQAILERLAVMEPPAVVRRFPDRNVTFVMRRDTFSEYLESLVQIGRYAASDARAVEALVKAAVRIAEAAREAGSTTRADAALAVAERVGRRGLASDAFDEEERESIAAILERSSPGRLVV